MLSQIQRFREGSIGLRAAPRVPQWVLLARVRSQAKHRVTHASYALKQAAAAAAAASAPATSTSTPASSLPPQLLRYQSAFQLPADWNYKYQRFPCASPVEVGDLRCARIEALFQHVLGYPRLPPRVHGYLRKSSVSEERVTATVEGLSARYGKELVLYMIRRCPIIMEYPIEELVEKADVARSMLDLKPHEVFMMLRKNPILLILDGQEARARLNKLHRVTPLSHESAKVMVRKCPLVLNYRTETISAVTEKLRHLAYTRVMWQQDFDCISPSLMAFFLKDSKDLLLRMEYLALTGDSATWSLFQVFKPSNNLFANKHRGFREWVSMRAARRQQLMRRAQQAVSRANNEQSGPGPMQ